MNEWDEIAPLLVEMNRQFVTDRMAVEPGHRRLLRRRLKSPHRRTFWHHQMPDDLNRECQYCGAEFVPDLTRAVGYVAAPASVVDAHRRAHCGMHCDRSYLSGLKYVRIKRHEIFERDRWRCYLCDQPTPADLRGFAYVPNAPSVDHIIPKGWGTDEPDNLRCCCRRCNLEKGSQTLWHKISMYVEPEGVNLFPEVLAEVLPRYPTLDELVGLWRQHIIKDGKPVETVSSDGFLSLINVLTPALPI